MLTAERGSMEAQEFGVSVRLARDLLGSATGSVRAAAPPAKSSADGASKSWGGSSDSAEKGWGGGGAKGWGSDPNPEGNA
jgi:hypothetical protein